MRARSPKTEIRYLRTVLRHARRALEVCGHAETPATERASWASLGIRLITEELAPRRTRRAGRRAP